MDPPSFVLAGHRFEIVNDIFVRAAPLTDPFAWLEVTMSLEQARRHHRAQHPPATPPGQLSLSNERFDELARQDQHGELHPYRPSPQSPMPPRFVPMLRDMAAWDDLPPRPAKRSAAAAFGPAAASGSAAASSAPAASSSGFLVRPAWRPDFAALSRRPAKRARLSPPPPSPPPSPLPSPRSRSPTIKVEEEDPLGVFLAAAAADDARLPSPSPSPEPELGQARMDSWLDELVGGYRSRPARRRQANAYAPAPVRRRRRNGPAPAPAAAQQ